MKVVVVKSYTYMRQVEEQLNLALSLLRDLVLELPVGEYNGVIVGEEEYQTEHLHYIVYKGYKIVVEDTSRDIDELVKEAKKVPLTTVLEALWRLSREAIKRYGREVEGWVVAYDISPTIEDWLFFARSRHPRVVYALVYGSITSDDDTFVKITRTGIEEIPARKLKEWMGVKVHKIFPDLFSEPELVEEPELIEANTWIKTLHLTGDAKRDIWEIVIKYGDTLLEDVEKDKIVKWLQGHYLLVGVPSKQAEIIEKYAFIHPGISIIFSSQSPRISVDPLLVHSVNPRLYEELKKKAGVKTTIVEVVEAVRSLGWENPLTVEELSRRIKVDVKPFLPYLVHNYGLPVFKHKGKIYLYKYEVD